MNYLSILFAAGLIASANGAYAFDTNPIIDLDRTAIGEGDGSDDNGDGGGDD